MTPDKVDPEKKTLFVIEKYIEDVKQDEKMESIMKGSGLVKEELRPILSKLSQFGSKITEIRVSTFWIPEVRRIPAGGQCQPSHV